MRGASFAVHAISELGFTGAAAALVAGIDPGDRNDRRLALVGFVLGVLSLRGRERDSAIGAVLAFGLGVGVLLLSLYQGYATEATNLLFGSIVGVSDSSAPQSRHRGGDRRWSGSRLAFRPLRLLERRSRGRGGAGRTAARAVVLIFLLIALTTAEAIQVVGVLLVLTLVITPAAAAQRLTGRPGMALS